MRVVTFTNVGASDSEGEMRLKGREMRQMRRNRVIIIIIRMEIVAFFQNVHSWTLEMENISMLTLKRLSTRM